MLNTTHTLKFTPALKPKYIPGVSDKYFNFQYYSGNSKSFDQLTERWYGREPLLEQLASDLLADKHNWCEVLHLEGKEHLPYLSPPRGGFISSSAHNGYHRDLRGVCIENLNTADSIDGLDWAYLDWCEFKNCNMLLRGASRMLFFSADLSHCKFTSCRFSRGSFFEGSMKNTVFYDCTFDEVEFNLNSSEKENYSNILFMNCKFSSVNFSRVDLKNICFTGNCQFKGITIENEDLMLFSTIGKNLLNTFREWDHQEWELRKKIKSVAYEGIKEPKIEMLPGKTTISYTHKFRSLQASITGLIGFYEQIAITRDNHTNREIFSRAHYILSWLIDQRRILAAPVRGRLRSIPGRYITGYGDRPGTPIIAWLVSVLFFAVLSGITGIRTGDTDYSFASVFASGSISDIALFSAKCVYFSVITATTVGFGDITPTPGATMIVSALNATIGMFIYTTFTVVIVRRLLR